jgi:hypothetical protein
MKLVSKIIVLLILCVVLVSAQSVVIDQLVRNLPIVDIAGCHWAIYDLADAKSRVCYESTTASVTTAYAIGLFWSAEISNFPSPVPEVGDSLLVIGSWDSAYVNPGEYGDKSSHTGFYWLYSDTLDHATNAHLRDDTLRVLPKPIVYKTGLGGGANDTIWVEIPNPRETRYTGQAVYDVLGYWLKADSTGSGTPNAFDAASGMEIVFIPVDGVYGDTTVFWMLESDCFLAGNTWPTYFAYKLVARPDTTGSDDPGSPGYSTYYFSQNSEEIDVYHIVIGIDDDTHLKPGYVKLEISPNPFTDRTDITCSIVQSAKGTELKIYDISGKLVKDFSHFTLDARRPTLLSWYGTDESGELLPSGVYFVQAKGGDLNLTKKVILQRK